MAGSYWKLAIFICLPSKLVFSDSFNPVLLAVHVFRQIPPQASMRRLSHCESYTKSNDRESPMRYTSHTTNEGRPDLVTRLPSYG